MTDSRKGSPGDGEETGRRHSSFKAPRAHGKGFGKIVSFLLSSRFPHSYGKVTESVKYFEVRDKKRDFFF